MEKINGYPIIDSVDTPKERATRAGRYILVDRGEDAYQRYVTAWQGRDGDVWDSSWCHGHYIDSLDAAKADLIRRAARYL